MAGRRTFRRVPGARVVVALASLALLASACTDAPEGSGEEGAGGSEIVHALGGEPEGLDPAQVTAGGYGDRVVIQVYEYLVDIAPEDPR